MYIARTWAPLGWPCLPTRCAITGTDHDLVFPLHYHIEDVSTVKIGLCGYHFPIDDIIIAAMKVWVNSIGADFYEHGIQALVHRWWKCIASSGDWWKTASYSWEFSLSNNVLVFFVSVVVSMEINRRHYLRIQQWLFDVPCCSHLPYITHMEPSQYTKPVFFFWWS